MKSLKVILLPVLFSVLGCATTKKIQDENIKLTYLDDIVLPEDLEIDGTAVGGLSGIDFHDGDYYLVSDQASNPRFYKAKIPFINRSLDTVVISEVVKLNMDEAFFQESTLDLEAIRFDSENEEIVISSEGSINSGKNPAIFHISPEGKFIRNYKIPEYFNASGNQEPRHNGVFEGLTESFDNSGFWVGMELPLKKDGPKPKIYKTNSPVRITKFSKETGKAEKQFAYQLDGITKFPINWFAINGLTELLEYSEDKFLVIERAYSAGYGSHGNTVKIFEVDATEATNTLKLESLKNSDYRAAEKRLVFDFKSIKNFLEEEIIDNIEGMTFGPELPNGNQSLILVSDDNFSSFGHQISQFILLEVEMKK